MTLTNRLLSALLFLIMPFLVVAQTANNLQAKFGAPSKTYVINSNVTLVAEFGEDGQACQMLITERHNSGISAEIGESSQRATAGDVLNDAAPGIQRGKRIQSTGSVGDCFNVRTDEYEKAIITDHSQLCGSVPNVKRTIQILWKQRRCQSGELIIDTRSPSTRLSLVQPFAALPKPNIVKEITQPLPCPNTEESNYVEYRRIYRKYEISQNAVILSLPQPDLTPEAIADKTTGKMIIEAVLHPCGAAVTNLVFRGYVRNGLAERASVAARKIKFKSAMNKGRAVPQRVQIEYNFYLCDKAPICTSVKEVME